MHFLWEQLIIVSSDGIIFCIVPQLTFFFTHWYILWTFFMLVHNSTTLFLIFCILLHNRTNEVHVDRHLSRFLSSHFDVLFPSDDKQCWRKHSHMCLPRGRYGCFSKGHTEEENCWVPVFECFTFKQILSYCPPTTTNRVTASLYVCQSLAILNIYVLQSSGWKTAFHSCFSFHFPCY